MKTWTLIFGFVLALGCDSQSKPVNPLAPSATPPPPEPVKEIAWELNGVNIPLNLKGTRVRVHRSNIETVITMTGGTTIVTMRNRGEMKSPWSQDDRATVEVTQPGLHCFSSPPAREEAQHATFLVQFHTTDLGYGVFEGDIPCFKGPERLKFKGSFQESR